MNIVNAIWEKRNLGVDVVEIVCSEKDTNEELESVIDSIDVPYSVVKIPSGRVDLLLLSQQLGYKVIELSYNYECNIKRIIVPGIYSRFLEDVDIDIATDELKERALNEIASGQIFTTDRIALDPMFSREISGIRYKNWCIDVLEGGADMEVAYYRGKPVVFNISKEISGRPGAYDGIIGGAFSGYLNSGLGFLLVHCEIETCKRYGGKYCIGNTSSNNMSSLRLHMQYGFDIKFAQYVLIKHI